MDKKKLKLIIEVVSAVSSVIGTIYGSILFFEHDKEYKDDMSVIEEGERLQEQYYMVSNDYYHQTISEQEYHSKLQTLIPLYEQHIDTIDRHVWRSDLAKYAISDRKIFSNDLELMKQEIRLTS
ncbi:hypothetical protein NTE_01800 [Candidatus Nitrososphaera evergladensis SR1]|uniref:Uncharacterized protein n=1 Tax=Candidatus Nitrososphaera evergladensis SR1 TaxID=1459636 RepID=A0A075MQP7_9ARCH|nr:hypothetical protein [Candidatus Nitrososphaera evergladensis]AIF83861.1 hypothetical protein NTE_01800 [Candidatus Nitrososphaera evergladensis SR1]